MNPAPPVYHRPLHVAAVALTIATFPLIFMGGLVTTHGAGMAVPDWPNSYGYNMFTFPPSQWVGGIWYEHVHRLLGTVVGFIAIIFAMQAWGPAARPATRRRLGIAAATCAALGLALLVGVVTADRSGMVLHETARKLEHGISGLISISLILFAAWSARRRDTRAWVRRLSLIVLAAVCVQGLLGGLRVTEVNLTLAIIHGCFAQAFLCLAAVSAVVTSYWWHHTQPATVQPGHRTTQGHAIVVRGGVAVFGIFMQLILGAMMRHNGAGLAIPDLPLAYGKLLPPTNARELGAVNQYRTWTLQAPEVTMSQVWLHFSHRAGAIVVTAVLAWLIFSLWRLTDEPQLRRRGVLLAILLLGQFTLGVLTVLWSKPADIASLHVAVGALLLMTTVVLTIRAARLYSSTPALAVEQAGVCSRDLTPTVAVRKTGGIGIRTG